VATAAPTKQSVNDGDHTSKLVKCTATDAACSSSHAWHGTLGTTTTAPDTTGRSTAVATVALERLSETNSGEFGAEHDDGEMNSPKTIRPTKFDSEKVREFFSRQLR
jgi:hypothetical protein